MTEVTHGELLAEIATLRGTTVNELKNLNKRLGAVEKTQHDISKAVIGLDRVATAGKASLRTLLWVGGLVTAGLSALAAAWTIFSGN